MADSTNILKRLDHVEYVGTHMSNYVYLGRLKDGQKPKFKAGDIAVVAKWGLRPDDQMGFLFDHYLIVGMTQVKTTVKSYSPRNKNSSSRTQAFPSVQAQGWATTQADAARKLLREMAMDVQHKESMLARDRDDLISATQLLSLVKEVE